MRVAPRFLAAINPLVARAAAELVEQDDKGHKTNVGLKRRPYDVLEKLTDELKQNGALHYIANQVMKSFEEFTLYEGGSFSKQAKARPLYAHTLVTDEKPDDLPDFEKFQCVFLDGVRRQGRDAHDCHHCHFKFFSQHF